MREGLIIDTLGYIVDVELVPIKPFDVTEIFVAPDQTEEIPIPEFALTGYQVSIPVPQGLYKPKFDLEAWDGYNDALIESRELYDGLYSEWMSLDEEDRGDEPVYIVPSNPDFWVEGLTQEEIEVIQRVPSPETVDQKIVQLESDNAFIALKLVDTQIRLDQTEQSQADLLLLLVGEGVL